MRQKDFLNEFLWVTKRNPLREVDDLIGFQEQVRQKIILNFIPPLKKRSVQHRFGLSQDTLLCLISYTEFTILGLIKDNLNCDG